jgi:membrane protein DedA with SNARE-associated domain
MPGLRTPTFFVAGMMHLKLRTFLLYDGGAALISAPTIVYLVWYFGKWVIEFIQVVEQNIAVALVAVIAALLLRWLWLRLRHRKSPNPSP